MKTASQIKDKIVSALAGCGVFDTVLSPSDDKKGTIIMREPSAAVYYSGWGTSDDNGVRLITHNYNIYMKFLMIGVNDTADDAELVIDALNILEPSSLTQTKESGGDKRTAMYLIKAGFSGCKS
ncbi:hypothetical protein Dacet_2236 [Denitrovibrio acetiphilus DSM 12809]|uniref:Uncharacterized protein n=1 Tax=Denitrovibrio acetiphilus (strain DSM 12809 / NBRC 114555 / N2460) TaxID=522772 RepID=D4H2X5_DENA2|nr:hypothetical protein [Denitrovibrio acetiphilus]ADD68998.1 hypothetical protein Dacet_2236 [Denitrovibrio acetiphilus DSM 12809]